jgi:hypothetical protein
VRRHRAALPVLAPGRLEAIRAAAERVAAGAPIVLAGNYLGGVGVPDAVASGLAAAERLLRDAGAPAVRERAAGPRLAFARPTGTVEGLEGGASLRQRRSHGHR